MYAYAREDLDCWEQRLGRKLSNGFFSENLTTFGLDVTGARLGARPGAYFRIMTPGTIRSGDPVEIIRRPDYEITISLTFRAITTERQLRARLAEASDDLPDEMREELRDLISDQHA